jgi:tetraacyldisaccharide 4'-kinase
MVTAVSLAADVGDEPLLLARRTAAPVVVCRSRARAARLAAAAGADVIVADDGLQHYALGRDLEIIVLDGERQLGNGRLLPAGPLREPASRLETAGLVLVNGGLPARGQIGFVLRGTSVVRLNGVERREPASFAGQKAWALAGIGNPSRFYAELRRHGIEPVPVAVPDHGRVDIGQLRRHAHGPLLMTEKDAVKYPDCTDSEAWYLPVDVDMPAAAEALIMAQVGAALNRRQRGVPRGAFQ